MRNARLFAPLATLAFACVLGELGASSAQAQTWARERTRPSLHQIISVDATGEPAFRYGAEDVAGDGSGRFTAAEQQLDLRTSYATTDAERLWLRSYVSANSAPPRTLVALYFFDTDSNTNTGGPASAGDDWPMLQRDPSPGGYEQVIGVRGDGTVLGRYRWNGTSRRFEKENDPASALTTEFGADRDPIGFGAGIRGYAQVTVAHQSSGLSATCRTQIFVRFWNDVAMDAYGDDDPAPAACEARKNAYGDPELLRSDRCDTDADCPAQGRCEAQVCLFAYACEADADCRDGERCDRQVCVRSVDVPCRDAAACSGLVCEAEACVACTATGARACPAGQLCTPGGGCITPGQSSAGGGATTNTDTDSDDGGVRGGAFRCSAGPQPGYAAGGWLAVTWVAAWWMRQRRRRSAGNAPRTEAAP